MAGPTPEPAAPAEPSAPVDDAPPADASFEKTKSNDKPFDDEPFDAGVEADENTDPKKFIEQLTGKLGQSLRKYNEELGQPDFELEKFAINSLLSATHTAEMDAEDQKDIINKIKKSGGGDETDLGGGEPTGDETDLGVEEPASEPAEDESDLEESMFITNPKKLSIFAPEGSEEAKFNVNESCWKGYKQVGMKEKNGKQVPNCVPINENLSLSENLSIFEDRTDIIKILRETFKQEDMSEPMIQPAPVKPNEVPVKPTTEPNKQPSRKDKPFLPMPNVQPDPKAVK